MPEIHISTAITENSVEASQKTIHSTSMGSSSPTTVLSIWIFPTQRNDIQGDGYFTYPDTIPTYCIMKCAEISHCTPYLCTITCQLQFLKLKIKGIKINNR